MLAHVHNTQKNDITLYEFVSSHCNGCVPWQMLAHVHDEGGGVIKDLAQIRVVGHRVVHGGSLSSAMLLDDHVLKAIRDACRLAPIHNPYNLLGIEVAQVSPATLLAKAAD